MDAWNITPVIIIYISAAILSLFLVYLGLKVHTSQGANYFSLMMSLVAIWIIAYIFELFNSNLGVKLVALKFEYMGMAGSVTFWFLFVASYTQYNSWINKRVMVFLFAIPAFTVFNALRAPHDTFLHTSYHLVDIHGFKVFDKNYNWGFYLWTAFAYTTMFGGVVFIFMRIVNTPKIVRKQLVFLIPAVIVVLFPNIFYITDNNPIEPYDPTPISLTVVGVLFLAAVYLHKFLHVVPVAHDLIFRNVRSGILIVDPKLRLLEINPIAEQILYANEKDLIGNHIHGILPEIKHLLSESSIVEEVKSEIKMGRDNHTFEVNINALDDSNGNRIGLIIMLWDITDQKMALEELDAYARTVAHDLKTPLSQIMGFAKLMKDGESSSEEKKTYLKHIIVSGDKMRNIVDGLLTLAKLRNQENISFEELDMERIMRSVHARLNEDFKEKNVEFVSPVEWKNAIGNSIWIEEVWVNLISNAIKYGGKPPYIEVGSKYTDDYVMYYVKDNGLGLDKDQQDYLFSEFSRIHPKKDKIKGHGLGLSIVKRVIHKLGGIVGVESEPGKGAMFYFKLPKSE